MRPIDRYHCEETFRRFDDYLDRELTPAEMELVREHLEHCERCARELRFEASVLRQVREKVRRITVPPDLFARISRALDEVENSSPPD
ncbi:MAG TPA: zf-HC2 domain-containing protein [Armatimonadota bacterium]|nr:zf-HC2 domain-containing protein [Armatimonadota bacterium]